jgi:hypothetical protein
MFAKIELPTEYTFLHHGMASTFLGGAIFFWEEGKGMENEYVLKQMEKDMREAMTRFSTMKKRNGMKTIVQRQMQGSRQWKKDIW